MTEPCRGSGRPVSSHHTECIEEAERAGKCPFCGSVVERTARGVLIDHPAPIDGSGS